MPFPSKKEILAGNHKCLDYKLSSSTERCAITPAPKQSYYLNLLKLLSTKHAASYHRLLQERERSYLLSEPRYLQTLQLFMLHYRTEPNDSLFFFSPKILHN